MRKASSTNLRNERWLLEQCPFSIVLSTLGPRWGAALLFKILAGHTTFSALAREIPLATEKMLTQELERLRELGLIEKRTRSVRPLRVDYVATARGRSLEPLLVAMRDWAEAQKRAAEATLPELARLERVPG